MDLRRVAARARVDRHRLPHVLSDRRKSSGVMLEKLEAASYLILIANAMPMSSLTTCVARWSTLHLCHGGVARVLTPKFARGAE
jgi:hypothetical protein